MSKSPLPKFEILAELPIVEDNRGINLHYFRHPRLALTRRSDTRRMIQRIDDQKSVKRSQHAVARNIDERESISWLKPLWQRTASSLINRVDDK